MVERGPCSTVYVMDKRPTVCLRCEGNSGVNTPEFPLRRTHVSEEAFMDTGSQVKKLDKKTRDALAKKNAEELMMHFCGRGFERAVPPNCPPKRGRRPTG